MISFNIFYLLGDFFKFHFKRFWQGDVVIEGDLKNKDKKDFMVLIGINDKLHVVKTVELYYKEALVYQIRYENIKKIKDIYIPKSITVHVNLGTGIYTETVVYSYIEINKNVNNNNSLQNEDIKGYEKITKNIDSYFY